MVVIKVLGGLGNQMFEYSLFKLFQKKGVNVKLDLRGCENDCKGKERDDRYNKSGFIIDRIFDTKCVFANKFEIYLTTYFPALFGFKKGDLRFYNKLHTTAYSELHFSDDEIIEGKHLEIKHGHLWGYWQHPNHFMEIIEDIKKDFTFIKPLDKKNEEWAQKIKSKNSVSVHVRRGDYLSCSDHFYILGKKYYAKAFEIISQTQKDAEFFVFSDDIPWCKENLGLKDVHYIDGNFGDKNYIDMQLMSLCKHNIIANSTFSLWAALLNDNKQKIVISPKNFLKGERDLMSKVLPEQFVVIDNVDELE